MKKTFILLQFAFFISTSPTTFALTPHHPDLFTAIVSFTHNLTEDQKAPQTLVIENNTIQAHDGISIEITKPNVFRMIPTSTLKQSNAGIVDLKYVDSTNTDNYCNITIEDSWAYIKVLAVLPKLTAQCHGGLHLDPYSLPYLITDDSVDFDFSYLIVFYEDPT